MTRRGTSCPRPWPRPLGAASIVKRDLDGTRDMTTLKPRNRVLSVSRGYGLQQRRVLKALERKARDRFAAKGIPPWLSSSIPTAEHDSGLLKISRARWRWYTIDLLGLAGPDATRGERVSLHRAINSLGNTGALEVRGSMPYDESFAEIGFDPAELSRFDPRWPHRHGRVLWFRRLPPWDHDAALQDGYYPDNLPPDDGAVILDFLGIHWPEWFADFCASAEPDRRWQTRSGAAVVWLFCGELPAYPPRSSRAR